MNSVVERASDHLRTARARRSGHPHTNTPTARLSTPPAPRSPPRLADTRHCSRPHYFSSYAVSPAGNFRCHVPARSWPRSLRRGLCDGVSSRTRPTLPRGGVRIRAFERGFPTVEHKQQNPGIFPPNFPKCVSHLHRDSQNIVL